MGARRAITRLAIVQRLSSDGHFKCRQLIDRLLTLLPVLRSTAIRPQLTQNLAFETSERRGAPAPEPPIIPGRDAAQTQEAQEENGEETHSDESSEFTEVSRR